MAHKQTEQLTKPGEMKTLVAKFSAAGDRTAKRGDELEQRILANTSLPKPYDHKAKVQAEFDEFMAEAFPDDHAEEQSEKAWKAISPEAHAKGNQLRIVGEQAVSNVVHIDVASIPADPYQVPVHLDQTA